MFCNFCGKPATCTIVVDDYPGRLCDTCLLEAKSEFSTATVIKDQDVPETQNQDFPLSRDTCPPVLGRLGNTVTLAP